MKRLLWIDDDERMIDNTVNTFKRNGFEIVKALTVSSALRVIREQRAQLDGILLDIELGGGGNGVELLEELRHVHKDVKVVIFTAFPDYSSQLDARSAGALAYFEKVDKTIPLDPDKQAAFFAALHRLFPDHPATHNEQPENKIQTAEPGSRRKSPSARSGIDNFKWAWFAFGCMFVLFAFILCFWAFGLKDLSRDQRFLLMWLLPLASGFACGCFAGSISAKGPVGPLVLAATGGFAVWILTYFLLKPPSTQGLYNQGQGYALSRNSIWS